MGNINKVCKKICFFTRKKIKNDSKNKNSENQRIENFPSNLATHKNEIKKIDQDIKNIDEIKNISCLKNEEINIEEKCEEDNFNDKFFEDPMQKVCIHVY